MPLNRRETSGHNAEFLEPEEHSSVELRIMGKPHGPVDFRPRRILGMPHPMPTVVRPKGHEIGVEPCVVDVGVVAELGHVVVLVEIRLEIDSHHPVRGNMRRGRIDGVLRSFLLQHLADFARGLCGDDPTAELRAGNVLFRFAGVEARIIHLAEHHRRGERAAFPGGADPFTRRANERIDERRLLRAELELGEVSAHRHRPPIAEDHTPSKTATPRTHSKSRRKAPVDSRV